MPFLLLSLVNSNLLGGHLNSFAKLAALPLLCHIDISGLALGGQVPPATAEQACPLRRQRGGKQLPIGAAVMWFSGLTASIQRCLVARLRQKKSRFTMHQEKFRHSRGSQKHCPAGNSSYVRRLRMAMPLCHMSPWGPATVGGID